MLAIITNDAMALPCAAAPVAEAFGWLRLNEASVVSLAHYSQGTPVLALYRPPVPDIHGTVLPKLHSRLVLACTTAHLQGAAQGLSPYRYRNWTMLLGGNCDDAPLVAKEQLLAIPEYLDKNRRSDLFGEVLFYQFLAFLHSNGGLAKDESDPRLVREALRSALSRVEALKPSGRDVSLLVTDGHAIHAASLDRPVYMRRVEGLKECMACGGDLDGNGKEHPYLKSVSFCDTDALPSPEWDTVGPRKIVSVDKRIQTETFAL